MRRLGTGMAVALMAATGCLSPRSESLGSGPTTTGGAGLGDVLDAGAEDAGAASDAGLEDAGAIGDAGPQAQPLILCSPAQLDFGLNPVGVSVTLKIFCTNIGGTLEHPGRNLFIGDPSSGASGLSIQNGDLAFSAAFNRPFPSAGMASGESVIIDVSYAPTAPGVDIDTLVISSNDATTPETGIGLSGTVKVLSPCEMTVEPTHIDLGNINAGEDQIMTLNLINEGVDECLVGAPRLINFPDPPNGYPVSPGSVIVPGGETLEMQLRLNVTQLGPWTGEIDFSASVTPPKVPVTATVL
jgi:hypothetical protein